VIGHALHAGPRPDARADWDGWIAAGFAIGSACFVVGAVLLWRGHADRAGTGVHPLQPEEA
jgi:hypothetical protein